MEIVVAEAVLLPLVLFLLLALAVTVRLSGSRIRADGYRICSTGQGRLPASGTDVGWAPSAPGAGTPPGGEEPEEMGEGGQFKREIVVANFEPNHRVEYFDRASEEGHHDA